MRLPHLVVAGSLALASAEASAQRCDLPGYAVVVQAADGAPLDTAYLNALARALAFRWQTPSARRADHAGWRRVRLRRLPPEPRWADDWSPESQHRAEMLLTVRRNGRLRAADPAPASGDRNFDRSLRTIATEPIPGAPDIPALPEGFTGDSLLVRVRFGAPDVPEGAGVVRFASAQTAVQLIPGTLEVVPRGNSGGRGGTSPSATVKYDVSADGTVMPSTVEILESSSPELTAAIREGLMRARFVAATSNCRPIAMSVLQRFGN